MELEQYLQDCKKSGGFWLLYMAYKVNKICASGTYLWLSESMKNNADQVAKKWTTFWAQRMKDGRQCEE